MRTFFPLLLLLMSIAPRAGAQPARAYRVSGGSVSFHSSAPKELISAASSRLSGIVDFEKKVFAFRIAIASFRGFNSPLQQEHFNENYLESTRFPDATFVGKIIEDIDPRKPGLYEVRAKGRLTVHGVQVERIMRGTVKIDAGGGMEMKAAFTVPLADHRIQVPRLVAEKLSELISVEVVATLPAP